MTRASRLPALALLASAIGLAASGCAARDEHGAAEPGDLALSFGPAADLAAPSPSGDLAEPIWFGGKVYAHSSTDLYEIDPDSLSVTHVGPFQWPGASDEMTDIALDDAGDMVGVSFSSVYAVDPKTAKCKLLAGLQGAEFNGLSYVATSAVDPGDTQILVGATIDGALYKVDPATGKQTLIGSYGNGYGSSGDIVSVEGATYATITGAGGNDFLAKLDTATGHVTPIGDTGFSGIWGLGYWKGKVFGFTSSQQFVLIDVTTGAGKLVQAGAVAWWGAGVTTAAPTIQ